MCIESQTSEEVMLTLVLKDVWTANQIAAYVANNKIDISWLQFELAFISRLENHRKN